MQFIVLYILQIWIIFLVVCCTTIKCDSSQTDPACSKIQEEQEGENQQMTMLLKFY